MGGRGDAIFVISGSICVVRSFQLSFFSSFAIKFSVGNLVWGCLELWKFKLRTGRIRLCGRALRGAGYQDQREILDHFFPLSF